MTLRRDPGPDDLVAAIADGAAIDWADVETSADRSQASLVPQLRVIDRLRAQHAGALRDRRWDTRVVTGLAAAAVVLAAVKVLIGMIAVPRVLLAPVAPSGIGPFALNLVVFGLGGLLLVFGGSRDRRLQLLGGFFVTIGAAFVQPFLSVRGGAAGVVVDVLRSCAPESFAMLLVWLFAWRFPHPPLSPAGQRLGRAFLAVAAVASVAAFLTHYSAHRVGDAPAALRLLQHLFDRDAPESLYWPLAFVLVLLAVAFMIVKARQGGGDSRRRTTWFLVALGVGLLPAGLAVIATPFSPALADPDVRRRVGVVVYAGLLSIVPTTAFAVAVQRVMDLQFVIRTALQYALARSAIRAAIVVPLGYLVLDIWVNRARTFQQFLDERQTVPLLALGGLALVTLTYRAQLVRAVDRWFLGAAASCCVACGEVHEPDVQRCACGADTRPADLPLVVHGKFRLHRRLGAGSTGVVYLATDLALRRLVTLKTLRRGSADRLRREARAMAAVRHPHLATIFGVEEWHDRPVLVVEYLDGGTLADTLARGPLAIDDVLRLGVALADVLDRMHGGGVLHRDIKPSNIGFTADGEPRLLDFGLAAMLDETAPITVVSGARRVVGTPLYLSPEALAGAPPNESFDLWSLHMVVYEAIAGRHPLHGQPVAAVVRAVPCSPLADVRALRPDCPAALAIYLGEALALDLARRPASAAAVRAALSDMRRAAGAA